MDSDRRLRWIIQGGFSVSIGSITSIGKQNAASSGGLKYKKLQKGETSICFIADNTVVDFASLVSFILLHGGSAITTQDGVEHKKTAIPCGRAHLINYYVTSYTSLIVSQSKQSGSEEWSTSSTITATGYHSTSGNPYDSISIDNTWMVI